MRLVITGASGFIGRQIIPFFYSVGIEVLIVGRDASFLSKIFPLTPNIEYDDLEKNLSADDTLVHLAVMNNHSSATLQQYKDVNVHLLQSVFEDSKRAKAKRFINVSTIKSIHAHNNDYYAISKREGEEFLASTDGVEIINLRLPAVYGDTYRGNLSILIKLPKLLQPLAFKFIAALKPTVSVTKVAKAILESLETLESSDRIVSDEQRDNFVYASFLRTVDIGFALTTILFFWWLPIIISIAIKCESAGPAIFKQKRVGKNGRLFTCYKFRTMRLGTAEVGTHQVKASAVTRIGGFLRKTKIDEIPQIWNLMKNDLSLVGPRPCLPTQLELINARKKMSVLDIKPGITGWAQIQNIDMSDPCLLARTDAEYLALRSILFDIRIILGTVLGRGQGDKVSF
jgi:lipopolysaccharide/colanic/teichoic acid biosynthesis glycosyltransferase